MNIVNRLLPADDLHWVDDEKKYCVASKEEIVRIMSLCPNMDTEGKVRMAMRYQEAKTSYMLFRKFMEGKISVGGLDEQGRPLFSPIEIKEDR